MRLSAPDEVKAMNFQWKLFGVYLNFLSSYKEFNLEQALRISTIFSDLMSTQTAEGVLENLLREGQEIKIALFLEGLGGEHRDEVTKEATRYLFDGDPETFVYDSNPNSSKDSKEIIKTLLDDDEIKTHQFPKALNNYIDTNYPDMAIPVEMERGGGIKSLMMWR